MSAVIPLKPKRRAIDVADDLDLKLDNINAVIDLIAICDAPQCNVNGAATAVLRMVEDAQKLVSELYPAPNNHPGGAS